MRAGSKRTLRLTTQSTWTFPKRVWTKPTLIYSWRFKHSTSAMSTSFSCTIIWAESMLVDRVRAVVLFVALAYKPFSLDKWNQRFLKFFHDREVSFLFTNIHHNFSQMTFLTFNFFIHNLYIICIILSVRADWKPPRLLFLPFLLFPCLEIVVAHCWSFDWVWRVILKIAVKKTSDQFFRS